MSKVVSVFRKMPSGSRYWLVLLLSAISLIFAALYYQYIQQELPCLMCIQVRIWLVLLIFVSIFGLLTRTQRWSNLVAQSGLLIIAGGLAERAYMLLGTERGFVFSDCGFDLGLPDWLAIDVWFPRLFRDPLFLQRLQGPLTWQRRASGGWRIDTPDLQAGNSDIQTRTRLHMEFPHASEEPVFMDLQTDFKDGDAGTTARYLPVGIMRPAVIDWLDRSIVSGRPWRRGTNGNTRPAG